MAIGNLAVVFMLGITINFIKLCKVHFLIVVELDLILFAWAVTGECYFGLQCLILNINLLPS